MTMPAVSGDAPDISREELEWGKMQSRKDFLLPSLSTPRCKLFCCSRYCLLLWWAPWMVLILVFVVYSLSWPSWSPFNTCSNHSIYADNVMNQTRTTFDYSRYTNRTLRFNELQYMCTHNSYHKAGQLSFLIEEWKYQLPALEEQLQLGVKVWEFDLHYMRLYKSFVNFHLQYLDTNSHCYCLGDCLSPLLEFSKTQPNHLPFMIQIEPKSVTDFNGICAQGKDDAFIFVELEQLILNIVGAERVVTPAMIQRDHTSLVEAITTDGWPSVEDLRGKFFFILIAAGPPCLQALSAAASIRSPRDAVLFTANQEESIFFGVGGERGRRKVDAGFVNRERYGNTADIVDSGMQFINTDYPKELLEDLKAIKKQQQAAGTGSNGAVSEGAICNSRLVGKDSIKYQECSQY